jgi:hypothetical protein
MTSFVASSRISVPGRPNDPKADQLHSPPPYMMNHSGYQFPDSPAIQLVEPQQKLVCTDQRLKTQIASHTQQLPATVDDRP